MLVPKINAHFPFRDVIHAMSALTKKEVELESADLFYLNHARAGLRIALSALMLPKGSKIGISTYNCYTVMNAIREAGHSIVFLDTTDNFTLNLNDLTKKSSELDALIVTHLYGLPNDLQEIKKICSKIPVIEDCAHAYLSASPDYKTGTIGDFAVYSVGMGKFPSIGDGGILQVNNHEYLPEVEKEVNNLQKYSIFEEIMLIGKLKFVSMMHHPLIYKWISLPNKKKQQKKQSINSNYLHKESKMAKSIKFLYAKKIKDYKNFKQLQQSNAKLIRNGLANNKNIILPKIDFELNNCFMLPFLHNDRVDFALKVSEFGVEIAPHFAKSIDWAKEFGYLPGTCVNSEKIAEQILVVPVHYNMKNKDLKKLITEIETLKIAAN